MISSEPILDFEALSSSDSPPPHAQRMLRTLLLCLAATASAQTLDDLYTITPVGKILSHCVHEVNEGAHSVEQVSGGWTAVVAVWT